VGFDGVWEALQEEKTVNREDILNEIEEFKKEGRKFLSEPISGKFLASYGIPIPPACIAKNVEKAVKYAQELGFPVVLKVISAQIIHKSDAGGVITNIDKKEKVREAFYRIVENARKYNPKAKIEGIYVQKMVPPGREVIIGVVKDKQFGPVVMFGLGGILVEVFKDVVFRVAPIDREEAREMIDEIKGLAILQGVRGEKPVDFSSLSEAIANTSRLAIDFPQIEQLDINPVCLYPEKIYALDTRIILE